MPRFDKLNDGLEQFKLQVNHYGFSAARLEDLGAAEYTLVTIIVDDSSSVDSFKNDMEATLKTIVEACRKSPRADNLLVRLCTFANDFSEIHGFKQLQTIKPSDYDGVLGYGGMTALYDAAHNGIAATITYGKNLMENDFNVNGIVFIITDGQDNRSKLRPVAIKDLSKESAQKECLESLITILVGVNATNDLDQYLSTFKDEAEITQYVGIGEATPQKLARLADFVSRSISQQSSSLGSGNVSQPLTF